MIRRTVAEVVKTRIPLAIVTLLVLSENRGDGGRETPWELQSPACSEFTSRVVKTADGFSAYVEAPQIARTLAGTFIIGSPSFAAKDDGTPFRVHMGSQPLLAGARIGDGGATTLLPLPSDTGMASPRLIVDPSGRLNVIWMNADSLGDAQRDRPIEWSAWIGNRWTPPTPLPGTENSGIWRRNSVSPPVAIHSRVFLVATFGVAPSRTRAIIWQGGKWIAHPMPAISQSYLSFATNGDTLIAAYVDYGAPDGNAVFVQRSGDEGRTFTPQVRISVSGSGFASDARILRLPSGRLVVLWIAEHSRAQTDLRSAYSDNGGESWRPGPIYTVAAGIVAMRADVSNTGKVVAIAQVGDTRRLVPNYLEWRDGEWSAPLPLIDDSSSTIGIPAIAAGDSVIMAWGEYGPRASRPVTKYLTLPATCRR